MRRSPRERRLGAVAAVVVCAAVLVGGVAHPLWERARRLDAEVRLSEEQLVRLRAVAARRRPTAQAAAAPPPAVLQRALIEQVEAWSQAVGLEMSVTPAPLDSGARRLDVEVTVEGAQPALLAFLDRVLAAAAPVDVERLSILPAVGEGAVRLVLRLSQDAATPVIESPSVGGMASLQGAAMRPLFQAEQDVLPMPEPPRAAGGRWRLLGLMPGHPAQAVLQDAQTQQTATVRSGQRLEGGWLVGPITEDRVLLQADGHTLELSL